MAVDQTRYDYGKLIRGRLRSEVDDVVARPRNVRADLGDAPPIDANQSRRQFPEFVASQNAISVENHPFRVAISTRCGNAEGRRIRDDIRSTQRIIHLRSASY